MRLVRKFFFRQIAIYLAFSFLVIGMIPSKGLAYVVDTGAVSAVSTRTEDIASIQRVLESKLISGKLKEMGLSKAEIDSRLDKLSDGEVHQFASQLDGLYPGGDAFGVIISLLVIAILFVVLLKLMDKKIIIK